MIFGLGQALRERNTFVDGAIVQSNFHDYEVMRMSDVPEIAVKVISTPDPSDRHRRDRAAGGGARGRKRHLRPDRQTRAAYAVYRRTREGGSGLSRR